MNRDVALIPVRLILMQEVELGGPKNADNTMGYVDRRRHTISNCLKCRVKHYQYHVSSRTEK